MKLRCVKLKSLVIADNNAAVNEKSGFAHTAHHARRVLKALRLKSFKRYYKAISKLNIVKSLTD